MTFRRWIVIFLCIAIAFILFAAYRFINIYIKNYIKNNSGDKDKTATSKEQMGFNLTYISICATMICVGATFIVCLQIFQAINYDSKITSFDSKFKDLERQIDYVENFSSEIPRMYALIDEFRADKERESQSYHLSFYYDMRNLYNTLFMKKSNERYKNIISQLYNDLDSLNLNNEQVVDYIKDCDKSGSLHLSIMNRFESIYKINDLDIPKDSITNLEKRYINKIEQLKKELNSK